MAAPDCWHTQYLNSLFWTQIWIRWFRLLVSSLEKQETSSDYTFGQLLLPHYHNIGMTCLKSNLKMIPFCSASLTRCKSHFYLPRLNSTRTEDMSGQWGRTIHDPNINFKLNKQWQYEEKRDHVNWLSVHSAMWFRAITNAQNHHNQPPSGRQKVTTDPLYETTVLSDLTRMSL